MNKRSKIITMIAEKTTTGFSAYSKSFPIFTTGKDIDELLTNSIEATPLYFDREISKINLIHI